MRSKFEILSMLLDPGIIPVVRLNAAEQILPVAEGLIAGGVRAIEITMTTPRAIFAMREVIRDFGSQAVIGVGSVLDTKTCREAIEAGAEFIVTPITRPDLVAVAQAADRPIMLGAYTPTEAQLAYEAGADLIKIFPANTLGPDYFKSLLAPQPHLRLVPTGGVDRQNVAAFFKAGCVAVGIGSSLITEKILLDSDWSTLTEATRAFIKKRQIC